MAEAIIRGLPWSEFGDSDISFLRRDLQHGRRNGGLYCLALAEHPEIIPAGMTMAQLYAASVLHDIGKRDVMEGDMTLWTRANLSSDDIRKIHNHPRASYNRIREVSMHLGILVPQVLLEIALKHQELLDGSGYPNGLTADQIPLHVQLFSVVDHAMGMAEDHEARPYREKGMYIPEIERYLHRMSAEHKLNTTYVRDVLGMIKIGDQLYIPELYDVPSLREPFMDPPGAE